MTKSRTAPSVLRAHVAFVSGRLVCHQQGDRVAGRRGAESLQLDCADYAEAACCFEAALETVGHVDISGIAQLKNLDEIALARRCLFSALGVKTILRSR